MWSRWADHFFTPEDDPDPDVTLVRQRSDLRFSFAESFGAAEAAPPTPLLHGRSTTAEQFTRERINDEIRGSLPTVAALSTLELQVCSWNVAQRTPPDSAELEGWLAPGARDGVIPDVVCVGLQETDVSRTALMLEVTAAYALWTEAITTALNSVARSAGVPHRYGTPPGCEPLSLVGMVMIIVARRDLHPEIRHVRRAMVRTGAMSVVGNKGAVGLRATILGKRFLFISAHFAAHDYNTGTRNRNYRDTLRDLVLDVPENADDELDWALNSGSSRRHKITGRRWKERLFGPRRGQPLVMSHDYAFFFGDLNYRLDLSGGLTGETVRAVVQRGEALSLLAADELRQGMQDGSIFTGFHEGPLTFAPTFKFDIGTDTLDSSRKQRVPAWTDRVLFRCLTTAEALAPEQLDAAEPSTQLGHALRWLGWRSSEREARPRSPPILENSIVLRSYQSFPRLCTSDHKPVGAGFTVGVVQQTPELPALLNDIWRRHDLHVEEDDSWP